VTSLHSRRHPLISLSPFARVLCGFRVAEIEEDLEEVCNEVQTETKDELKQKIKIDYVASELRTVNLEREYLQLYSTEGGNSIDVTIMSF
jgi:hypothetical protein